MSSSKREAKKSFDTAWNQSIENAIRYSTVNLPNRRVSGYKPKSVAYKHNLRESDDILEYKTKNYDSFKNKNERKSEYNKKIYDRNIDAISFNGSEYDYSSAPIQPLVNFFKCLSPVNTDKVNYLHKTKLQIRIPDTFVFGLEENPFWIYTGTDGYLYRVENVTHNSILKKLGNSNKEDSVVAVIKRPIETGKDPVNDITLMSTKQLSSILEHNSQGVFLFQKFVKSKGSKASFARLVWNKGRPPFAYIINNKKEIKNKSKKEPKKTYIASTDNQNSLNFFKVAGKSIEEISEMSERTVNYLENTIHPRIYFQQFVADFIKDENDTWWFIQVKAFKLDPSSFAKEGTDSDEESLEQGHSSKSKFKKSTYMKYKECAMCLELYPRKELEYSASLKMIYSTEQHLKKRGIHLPWFGRPEFRSTKETSMWYQELPICKNCFDLYLQEQKLASVEVKFAKAIGIPVTEKSAQNASILNNVGGKLHNTTSDIKINRSDTQSKSKLLMYRMMIYINELRDLPQRFTPHLNLKMKLFNRTYITPITVWSPGDIVKIDSFRVIYFFVQSREHFMQWIKQTQGLNVQLEYNRKTQGRVQLNLDQFASGLVEKLDYVKMFSGKALKLCSLRATLGFAEGRKMEAENLDLNQIDGVYLPHKDFYTSDPLPDMWVNLLPKDDTVETSIETLNINQSSGKPPTRPSSRVSRNSHPDFERPSSTVPLKTSRPMSATLRRRNEIKHQQQQQQQQTITRGKYPKFRHNYKRRPSSASSFHSLKRSRSRQPRNYSKSIESDLKEEEETRSALEDMKPVEELPAWKLTFKVLQVYDLGSPADVNWIFSFSLFDGHYTFEYESFQMIENTPLVFDDEDSVWFVGSNEHFDDWLEENRYVQATIIPKYGDFDERIAIIDLGVLRKTKKAECSFVVEKNTSETNNFIKRKSTTPGYYSDSESESAFTFSTSDFTEPHRSSSYVQMELYLDDLGPWHSAGLDEMKEVTKIGDIRILK